MRMQNRPRHFTPALAVLVAALVGAGCGDDEPLAHNEAEPDPDGLTIAITGQAGVIVANGQVQGSITVAAGGETENFTVVFTDHDGNALSPDETEFFVQAVVADETVVDFHSVGAFRGHLEGLAAGTTTVVFQFMHPPGPDAHSNYDSPPIPVTVQ